MNLVRNRLVDDHTLALLLLCVAASMRSLGADSPTAHLQGSTNLCAGGIATIRTDLIGLAPWSLVWSDGLVETNIVESPATRVVNPSITTVYTLTSVWDGFGATGSVSGFALVRVIRPPSITAQPASVTLCEDQLVNFTIQATGAAHAQFEDDSKSTDGLASATFAMPTRVKGAEFSNSKLGISPQINRNRLAAPDNGTDLANLGMATDRVLLKPTKARDPGDLVALHLKLGTKVTRSFPQIENLEVVTLPPGLSVEQAIHLFQGSGLVDYVEPDYEVHALLSPNDPWYLNGSLWYLNNTGQLGGTPHVDISADAAWDTRTSANPVVVAVIDTGVWYPHEDLSSNMWINPCVGCPVDGVVYPNDLHGINARAGTGDPIDDGFHGTHVAGVLGAVGDNGLGVVGVAWNVRIMACKFQDPYGNGFVSDAATCINYAVRKGAKILVNSWGQMPYDLFLRDVIVAARRAGVIFVVAAGNSSADNDVYQTYNCPAVFGGELDNVVAVAATDQADQLAWFSNFGASSVALAAPGIDIWSTVPAVQNDAMVSKGISPNYAMLSGTSTACPQVAGALALVWAQYPDDSYSQIIQRLLSNTDPLNALDGRTVTAGRLNLSHALSEPLQAPFWLSYQWRRNGTNLQGQTSSRYFSRPALVSAADNGSSFDVVITNLCGSVTSSPALLTVNTHLKITSQPTSSTRCQSNELSLLVGVTGSEPISYQWRKVSNESSDLWVLTSSGPGSGSAYIGSSTNNGDATFSPDVPADIDSHGVAFGLSATDGHITMVTRAVSPLVANSVLAFTMDNGFVSPGGAEGFGLYNSIGQKVFELFCTNNTYYYDNATDPTPKPVPMPFTFHGIKCSLDMMSPTFLIAVVDPEDGSGTIGIETPLPDQSLNPPDHIVLYNFNGGSSPGSDIFFNSFVFSDHNGVHVTGRDDASQPAYGNGWPIGVTSDLGPIPGATNRIFTISSCAPADSGIYDVLVNNECGSLTSVQVLVTVRPGPCGPSAQPPEAPSNLTASLQVGHQVALSWTTPFGDQTGFAVDRALDNVGSPGSWVPISIINGWTTNWVDVSATPATTYWYRVRARNDLGYSDFSNFAKVITPAFRRTVVVAWGRNEFGQTNIPPSLPTL